MKFASNFKNPFLKKYSQTAKDWPVFTNKELLEFLQKQPQENGRIVFTIGTRIFHAVFNTAGNVSSVFLQSLTPEARAAQIGEYIDEERSCASDAGSIVINGIKFSNGYGDGSNTVIVRTFTKRPVSHAAYCRAQIYNEAKFHSLQKGAVLRIEDYDCNKAGEGKACFEGPATGFVQHGRKVWVIIDNTDDKK